MDRRTCLNYLTTLGLSPFIIAAMETPEAAILKRIIPSTGELLPVIGVGTWQTFNVSSSAEKEPLKEVLKVLVEKGGTVVDSSPMYGASEKVVGELSSSVNLNTRLFMATKVWTTGKQNGIEQMNESFSLLQRKQIDLMQIHNLKDWQTHLGTLRELKEQGKIRYIGITHYLESAYTTIENLLNSNAIDFLQINYSLVSRKAEERLFPLAAERKVAVLINQPFEEGALFQRVKGIKLPDWAAEFDCTSWGQFFLKFILSNPTVNCVIPGTSKPHHMLDNLSAGYGQLPDKDHLRKMISLVND